MMREVGRPPGEPTWGPGARPRVGARPGGTAFRPVSASGRRSARTSRWLLLGLGLGLVLVMAWWFFWREGPPDFRRMANLAAPGDTVVFLGDSITKGYGLREEEAFPGLVAATLGIPHVNAGVSGDTTTAALARLEQDVLMHQPRITLVELGGNDFLRRVPAEQTLRNMEAIVRTLTGQGGMVVVLHVSVGVMGDPYLQGFREVAQRYGALLVADIMRGILSDPALKLDPIHPNAQGQRLIADRVAKVLRPLLVEAERGRGEPKPRAEFPLLGMKPVG